MLKGKAFEASREGRKGGEGEEGNGRALREGRRG